jgi:hypothetical protein
VGEPCRVFVAWRGGRPVQFWSTSSTLPGVGKAQGNTPLLTACAGPSSGKPMIANVAQARPLWRSEAVAPDCWRSQGRSVPGGVRVCDVVQSASV